MGTETIWNDITVKARGLFVVKLNNPLMGTETYKKLLKVNAELKLIVC